MTPAPAPKQDTTPRALDERRAAIVRFFEHLAPADLVRLDLLYTPEARFTDPFNDVTGTQAIARIFHDMFARLEAPKFEVLQTVADGDRIFLTWDFTFRFKDDRPAGLQRIHGGTLLHLDRDGRILSHRDYWDAAGELYTKLPLLGALMRWLRRRLAA